MLLGSGLVGGIMRNNGRFTGLEEIKYMGASELVNTIDKCYIHKNINFPGHKHASFYNVLEIESEIRKLLLKRNITIKYNTRINKAEINNNKIISVTSDKNEIIMGDVFIDATGTFGPMNNCIKYGLGCASCIYRCSNFSNRVSLTNLCNIKEYTGTKKDGTIGSMSGSCKILKESLSKEIIDELNNKGFIIIPLENHQIEDHLNMKVCQQYALDEYKNNLILLDTGEVKLMMPFYPLDKLRIIEGFDKARYLDPYCGGNSNSMRFFAISPRNNQLKVNNIDNLFCCGEKANLVGHTEAIITGVLAGYNASRLVENKSLLTLPLKTASGLAISFSNNNNYNEKYTLSGSILYDKIKKNNLYTTKISKIKSRIIECNLYNIFNK